MQEKLPFPDANQTTAPRPGPNVFGTVLVKAGNAARRGHNLFELAFFIAVHALPHRSYPQTVAAVLNHTLHARCAVPGKQSMILNSAILRDQAEPRFAGYPEAAGAAGSRGEICVTR